MPQAPPYDLIPDGFGGFWKIITWECHLCGYKNWVSDNNNRYRFGYPEKCRTGDCNHNRCWDCYDCDEDDVRLQHCDGAIPTRALDPTTGVPIESFPAWTPLLGDTRPLFPCPLQIQRMCNKVFLRREHATFHAVDVHRPWMLQSCGYAGCERMFKRIDDRNAHLATHTAVMPIVCRVPECGRKFDTFGQESEHLLTHFGWSEWLATQNASQSTANASQAAQNAPQSAQNQLRNAQAVLHNARDVLQSSHNVSLTMSNVQILRRPSQNGSRRPPNAP